MKTKSLAPLFAISLLSFSPAHAAEKFQIDPAHTSVSFAIRHFGISNVHGRFDEVAGSVTMDGDKLTAIQGTVQVKSLNTGVEKRDQHVLTKDFLDAEKFPTITFKTKSIETIDGKTTLTADFTLHGVTKEVTAPVTLTGPIVDPEGKTRIGLHTTAQLNRHDYGITYNATLESGAALVGEQVTLEINAEAILEDVD